MEKNQKEITVSIGLLREMITEAVQSAVSSHNQSQRITDHPLTEIQAAELLGVKPQTLALWRTHGKGPEYLKIGSNVRYESLAIQNFKMTRRVRP